jgi:hypothetical protein
MAKFGPDQFSNPTPTGLVRIVLIYSALSDFFRVNMMSHLVHNDLLQHEIDWWLGNSNSLIIILLPFFGVQTKGKTVPVSEVTAMKDNVKMIIWFILSAGFILSK